jgi:hypothetical protein
LSASNFRHQEPGCYLLCHQALLTICLGGWRKVGRTGGQIGADALSAKWQGCTDLYTQPTHWVPIFKLTDVHKLGQAEQAYR